MSDSTALPSVTDYRDVLVKLVIEAYLLEPARFENCKSWSALHDVCDANEFLIEADELLGFYSETTDQTVLDLYNEAVEAAEATLWPSAQQKEGN